MDSSACNTGQVGPYANSWMELSKSDYAKVIFCDILHHSDSIGCRFQITDNVHEDPCDYVGLYRVGYDNLDQCIVCKMLSETQCEEDGKVLRCVFKNEELPKGLEDKFYQFLYVTRDKEVCGASTPFEIKQEKEDSDEDIVADKTEDDFLVVRSTLGERNRKLEILVNKYRLKTNKILEELEDKKKMNERMYKEKEELQQQVLSLRRHLLVVEVEINKYKDKLKNMIKQLEAESRDKSSILNDYNKLLEENKQLKQQIKEKDLISVYEESQQSQEKQILEEQLEDAKVMIKALEESKVLALNEVKSLTKLYTESQKDLEEIQKINEELNFKLEEEQSDIQKWKKELHELKCVNVALNLKMEDEATATEKWKKELHELKCVNVALNLKLEDEATTAEKLLKERTVLQDQRRDLKKTVEEKNILIQMQNEEISKLERSVKDLKRNLEEKAIFLKKPIALPIRQQLGLKLPSAKEVRKHLVTWNMNKHVEKQLKQFKKMKEDPGNVEYKFPELSMDEEFVTVRPLFAKPTEPLFGVIKSVPSCQMKEQEKALEQEVANMQAAATSSEKFDDKKTLHIENGPSGDAVNNFFENIEDKENKIFVLERMIEELKINLVHMLENQNKNSASELEHPLNSEDTAKMVELFTETCSYKGQIEVLKEKLDDKTKDMEKMSDQINDLQSKCMQWDDEVSDLKAHCAELRADIAEKEELISKLREDCIKKDAVVEYLKKEKDEILKAEAILRVAHDDSTERIKEAADLYRKQYIEIAKLKKKVKKYRHLLKKEDSFSKCSSDAGDMSSKEESTIEKSKILDDVKLPNPNVSDSDTGEHVVEPTKHVTSDMNQQIIGNNGEFRFILNSAKVCEYKQKNVFSKMDKESTSAKNDGEVTLKMQEMIEQNLAGLSSSKTESFEDWHHLSAEQLSLDDSSANNAKKEFPDLQTRIEKDVMNLLTSDEEKENPDEVIHVVSCSICLEPINISYNNNDALVLHLEKQHKQEMCPICGRLFDMTLPKKYFIYHVESHFTETD